MSGHSKWHNIQAKKGKADAALAASVFHFEEIKIPELKQNLCEQGINVR